MFCVNVRHWRHTVCLKIVTKSVSEAETCHITATPPAENGVVLTWIIYSYIVYSNLHNRMHEICDILWSFCRDSRLSPLWLRRMWLCVLRQQVSMFQRNLKPLCSYSLSSFLHPPVSLTRSGSDNPFLFLSRYGFPFPCITKLLSGVSYTILTSL